ncbi:hypothetical protein [Maritimibacter sp. UBA3975]|uniref:hypothetical protein n=1 Tax=Maritimibacter sp. UBA3975 TaxID=1946833 RepID=UPI000C0B4E07|nr:hypothetical protein [Maritimibacter sp. UBA3975]MAM60269.1 hypothetical protein [Maritimibacter sp.]|tara:strand:+ start:17127 stop:17798 length:672 start_codon:yes stop_codon:yes gene_type:complete
MIICHARELIFLKGRKVGGTSFEIALSLSCGPGDVITPLTEADEALRVRLGGRGAQNYARVRWPGQWRARSVAFRNHSPAARVRAQVPDWLWSRYRKIAISRDPFEVAVSRYFWRRARGAETEDFGEFVDSHRNRLAANARIAPFEGPDSVDHFLRYDRLAFDAAAVGLSDVYDAMQSIAAKAGVRPPEATAAALYSRHPHAAAIISETCATEIAHFGYRQPV